MTLDELITSVLKKEVISDQESLRAALARRGRDVNQSTLSRHLRKLGARKHEGRYVVVDPQDVKTGGQGGAPAGPSGSAGVLAVTPVPPNLLIVRTLPGHAHALGYRLDALSHPTVAGTVAGDDTLFIAVRSPDGIERLRRELETRFDVKHEGPLGRAP